MGTVYQVCVWYVWYVWYATGMGMGMVWYGMDTHQGTARGKVWAKESRLLWMH